MRALFALSVLLICVSSGIVLDHILPSKLEGKYTSKAGRRDAAIDANLRLLTVLALQQNVRMFTNTSGWQLYKRHFYRFYDVDLHWVAAENFCRSLGGHLVSIEDEAENRFVHQLRKKSNIWIGLNKLNDSSSQLYEWSDDASADFLNWDSTQPNEPNVDCAYMAYQQDDRFGTWFDYACEAALPNFFVCKSAAP